MCVCVCVYVFICMCMKKIWVYTALLAKNRNNHYY